MSFFLFLSFFPRLFFFLSLDVHRPLASSFSSAHLSLHSFHPCHHSILPFQFSPVLFSLSPLNSFCLLPRLLTSSFVICPLGSIHNALICEIFTLPSFCFSLLYPSVHPFFLPTSYVSFPALSSLISCLILCKILSFNPCLSLLP